MKFKKRYLAPLILTGALVPSVAGALGGPPANNYHQQPSCSLHPFDLTGGEYVFQNQNEHGDWPIPLTVWDATNENIVYQGFLSTGQSTPILQLGLDSGIGWSNNYEGEAWSDPASATYSLRDYDSVNWCNKEVPTTTTTVPEEPTTTTTAPPVEPTTTVPTAPVTSVPTAPTTTDAVAQTVFRPAVCVPNDGLQNTGEWGPNDEGKSGFCSLKNLALTGPFAYMWQLIVLAVAAIIAGVAAVRKFNPSDVNKA